MSLESSENRGDARPDPGSRWRGPGLGGVGLGLLLALAMALQIVALRGHSLTGDGSYHLIAGHQALRYGENVVNLEHPPLAKLVMALPTLLEPEPITPPLRVEEVFARSFQLYEDAERVERLTRRARWCVLTVFIVPFFVATYRLGRRFGGRRTGYLLSLITAFSLSVLPNLTLLQTDAALSLGYLATLLALFAWWRRPTWPRAVGLGLALGFALAVKFSGFFLLPVVAWGVLSRLASSAPSPTSETGSRWHRTHARSPGSFLAHGSMMLAVAFSLLMLTYRLANWHGFGAAGRAAIESYTQNRGSVWVGDRLRSHADALLALYDVFPELAQWLTGFLGVAAQNALGVYPSYALGEISFDGRWWYFPFVLLVKTPLVLLVIGLWIGWRGLRRWRPRVRIGPLDERAFMVSTLVLTAAIYLLMAMTSNYNLGVRHLLPVTVLLYLPIAVFLARRRWGPVVVGLLAIEALALSPYWLSATNTWWLGEHNPSRFALAAGNLEYRQNFKLLAAELEERQISAPVVFYPALDPKVLRAYLPEARQAEPSPDLRPGWYVLNIQLEQHIPALLDPRDPRDPRFAPYRDLAVSWDRQRRCLIAAAEDQGYVAATFHLYRLDEMVTCPSTAP